MIRFFFLENFLRSDYGASYPSPLPFFSVRNILIIRCVLLYILVEYIMAYYYCISSAYYCILLRITA